MRYTARGTLHVRRTLPRLKGRRSIFNVYEQINRTLNYKVAGVCYVLKCKRTLNLCFRDVTWIEIQEVKELVRIEG